MHHLHFLHIPAPHQFHIFFHLKGLGHLFIVLEWWGMASESTRNRKSLQKYILYQLGSSTICTFLYKNCHSCLPSTSHISFPVFGDQFSSEWWGTILESTRNVICRTCNIYNELDWSIIYTFLSFLRRTDHISSSVKRAKRRSMLNQLILQVSHLCFVVKKYSTQSIKWTFNVDHV